MAYFFERRYEAQMELSGSKGGVVGWLLKRDKVSAGAPRPVFVLVNAVVAACFTFAPTVLEEQPYVLLVELETGLLALSTLLFLFSFLYLKQQRYNTQYHPPRAFKIPGGMCVAVFMCIGPLAISLALLVLGVLDYDQTIYWELGMGVSLASGLIVHGFCWLLNCYETKSEGVGYGGWIAGKSTRLTGLCWSSLRNLCCSSCSESRCRARGQRTGQEGDAAAAEQGGGHVQ